MPGKRIIELDLQGSAHRPTMAGLFQAFKRKVTHDDTEPIAVFTIAIGEPMVKIEVLAEKGTLSLQPHRPRQPAFLTRRSSGCTALGVLLTSGGRSGSLSVTGSSGAEFGEHCSRAAHRASVQA